MLSGASPPCTIRGLNALMRLMSLTKWGWRSRQSATRPRPSSRRCLIPACSPRIRSTSGEPARAPASSSPARSQRLEDESVDAVALAVDLITELDGDTAYQLAALDAANRTDKPVVVLSNLPGAIDQDAAVLLRSRGVPVLEGLHSGLRALRDLLEHQARAAWKEP